MTPAPEDAATRARGGDVVLQQRAVAALGELVLEAAEIVDRLITLENRTGTAYRNFRAAALLSERKLVEFLLDPQEDFHDAIRPTDFGIAWTDEDLGASLKYKLRDRKMKLNRHIAHLNWTAIDSPRSWRLARMSFVVDGLALFTGKLSAAKPELAEQLRLSIESARAKLDLIPPEEKY